MYARLMRIRIGMNQPVVRRVNSIASTIAAVANTKSLRMNSVSRAYSASSNSSRYALAAIPVAARPTFSQ